MKNHPIAVISTYPPKGSKYGHKLSAVASYAKNTLDAVLGSDNSYQFEVIADIRDKRESYVDDGVTVHRVWRTNSILAYWDIAKFVVKGKYKKIVVEYEWALFGNKLWMSIFLPFFVLLFRMLGKKVYTIQHAVLLDANKVSGQINTNKVFLKLFTFAFKILYLFIVLFSTKVVVFEESLRKQLISLTGMAEKIVTIPHGVDEYSSKLTKTEARRKLKISEDTFLICNFGFHIWYKGSDWVAQAIAHYLSLNEKSDLKLIMAGGPTQKYLKDSNYQKLLRKINKAVAGSNGKIEVTGFVEEKDIEVYFMAADLIIFPYRVFLSSSGPLSLAFTYRKPFLLSEPLGEYFQTNDFSSNIRKSHLSKQDVIFSLNQEDLFNKIEEILKNRKILGKLSEFSSKMYESRKWSVIGKSYAKLLNE